LTLGLRNANPKYSANRLTIMMLIFLFSVFSPFYFVSSCHAAEPKEEYKKIQKEIKKQKTKLEKAKKREYSVLADIDGISRDLNIVEGELRKYRQRILKIESDIVKVESEISDNKKTIEKYQEWIKRKLRAMQKYGNTADVVMLLSIDDVSQLMRSWKSMQNITAYEHRMMNSYKENLESLHEKEARLVQLRAELVQSKEKVKTEEASLEENKKHKEDLLASIKNEKSSYSRMLKELENTSKKLLEIIRESEKGETFTLTGFSKLKGKLPWPLNGKIIVPYGTQRDPQFNTPIFRSGTYIQSNDDSFAKAVYGGKVVFAEWFKGYGELVIVNHGEGYHTLYGSLSEIFTKVGDIIKVKQKIGRVGNSGILNEPSLYFELRYKGKPLDPMQWLKRR
jgi:septal ring factor EnvC (AmiA/AmiB activator)